jgi:chorismate synthase
MISQQSSMPTDDRRFWRIRSGSQKNLGFRWQKHLRLLNRRFSDCGKSGLFADKHWIFGSLTKVGNMLRYWTAGESHGKALVALIDGFPAGLQVDTEAINSDLKLRQGGYGRGGRQKLETDEVDVLSGTWQGATLGSPIALQVINRDYKIERLKELERPRPGHADLTGAIKYLGSIRGVLERSSARETTVRVAAGSLAKQLLQQFGIETLGYVVEIGGEKVPAATGSVMELRELRGQSIVYSTVPADDERFRKLIDDTAEEGDTVGGIIEVRVDGLPFGLGTHAQWDRKLDGRLAQAVMAVQAIKGVEIGLGFEAARRKGSQVHDPIHFDAAQKQNPNLGYVRPTNNAGGLEGGMTNGQPLIVRAAKKPISTLRKPLDSIQMESKEPHRASYERSDVCAISAAAIIVECVVAFEVAAALIEKFGGDSVHEMKARYDLFLQMARAI